MLCAANGHRCMNWRQKRTGTLAGSCTQCCWSKHKCESTDAYLANNPDPDVAAAGTTTAATPPPTPVAPKAKTKAKARANTTKAKPKTKKTKSRAACKPFHLLVDTILMPNQQLLIWLTQLMLKSTPGRRRQSM